MDLESKGGGGDFYFFSDIFRMVFEPNLKKSVIKNCALYVAYG